MDMSPKSAPLVLFSLGPLEDPLKADVIRESRRLWAVPSGGAESA